MTTPRLRQEIKKSIDKLPRERLESVADFVAFLNRPSIGERLATAETAIAAGKGRNWRSVRKDV